MPSVVPSVGPTAAFTASPPAPIYASWAPLAFPEPTPHVYGGSGVAAAVAFRGAYVAVGGVNGGCCDGGFSTDTHGVVWRSSDGLAWTLEPRAAVFDLARISGLATDGRTLVAVGARMLDSTIEPGNVDPHGAAWTSTDGRTWTRVTGMPWLSSIVHAEGAFLALTESEVGTGIWRSVDGRSWSQVAGQGAFGPGIVQALAATPVGLVAVGWMGVDPDSQAAVSWQSVDGVTWTRAPTQDSLDGASMTSIAVSGSTIVAVGDRPDAAAAWWSTDGLTWSPSGSSILDVTGGSVDRLVSGNRGLIATGIVEGTASDTYPVWASADGRTWQEIDARLFGNGPTVSCAVDRGVALTVFGEGFDATVGREVPAAWDVR